MDHHQLHGTYDHFLVILSYLIAVTASYSALDLAGRVNLSKGKHRLLWLIFGAFSMGLGIWSMHFVGMLALTLPIKVFYDIKLVVLSVVFAVIVSWIALQTVTRNQLEWKQLITAGVLMAAGICSMHYTGMAAMIIEITYNTYLVILSVIIAGTASIAALWLLFYFRKDQSRFAYLYKLGSSLIMGAAIAGMHYTGMVAAQFHASEDTVYDAGMQIETETLAYIIVAATFLLLGVTLFGVFINKRFSQKDSVIQENESWYRSLYKNNEYGIISIDTKGKIINMNPAVSKIGGIKTESYVNQHISKIGRIIAEDEREKTKELFYQSFEQLPKNFETTIVHPNGKRVELSVINVPVEIQGEVVGNHIIVKDITDENVIKKRIKHQAYHDELTGLPNRRKFNEILTQAIERGRDGSFFAVMVIDIDRFKMINDSLGHTYGDLFLQGVSDRIVKIGEGYEATVARMGGDEFTIICNTGADGGEALRLAKQIIDVLQLPFHLKDSEFYISASIGTALFPTHGKDPVELLKKADAAMYEVKKQGKNGHQFYSPELDIQLMINIELESDLRKAIERNELVVYYQPQFHAENNRMIGVEALVRWNHPKKGLLSPGLFIPIAEETGMIYEIGTWVMREACLQMKRWHDDGGPLIPVSVNLSSQQFHQPNLVEYIKNILGDTGLEPRYLELEITESMMMDPAVSISILQDLNNIGIRISLDDFGTGYSSLSYLKKFPIHKLKIDRSFITDISENSSDKAIVATIISMAQHLKLDVIAEGIETKDQLDILTKNDCKEIQGYYFSRPLSAKDVEKAFFTPTRIV